MPLYISLKPLYSSTIHIRTRPFSLRDCYYMSKSCRSRAASGFGPINVRNREGQGKDRDRSEGGNSVPSMRERGSAMNIVWRDFFRRCVCSEMRPNNATLSRRYHAGWEIPRPMRANVRKGDGLYGGARCGNERKCSVCDISRAANAVVRYTCRGALIRRWGEKRGGEGGGERPCRDGILEFAQDNREMRTVSNLSSDRI